MENQNVENTTGTVPGQQQDKNFTQEQVNAIVGKRLMEQKQQLESDFVKRESELSQREMSIRAKELLQEKGLPKDLADVLRYDNEESLIKAIETIVHTKGFKHNQGALAEEKHIVENRLETGDGHGNTDLFKGAFSLNNKTPLNVGSGYSNINPNAARMLLRD